MNRPSGPWDELHNPRALARETTEAACWNHGQFHEGLRFCAEGLDHLPTLRYRHHSRRPHDSGSPGPAARRTDFRSAEFVP